MKTGATSLGTARGRGRGVAAFTMVEIALCLGVIAIALVAIIGVLPTGIRVQRDNREDTILQQDGAVLLEAIRNGSWGLNYLTNHLHYIDIKNAYGTVRHVAPDEPQPDRRFAQGSVQLVPDLQSGLAIVSLLSTNRYVKGGRFGIITNTVEALIRPLTGSAFEKSRYAFTNRENAFMYYMYLAQVEIVPIPVYRPMDTNFTAGGLAPEVVTQRSNDWARAIAVRNQEANFSEIRLTLQGVFLRGSNTLERVGTARTFRTLVPGRRVVVDGHPIFAPQQFQQVETTGS